MERSKQSPNVDRLSVLPDEILCHILSFLPTKSSAATSILARRWRFLRVDVPTIDLDFFCRWNRKNERPRTSVIFNTILLGHTLKALNTFRLNHTITDGKDKLSQRLLNKWLAAVIASDKVQNIKLYFGNYRMKLPECLFTCKSLVDLRLRNCEIRIPLPASISFPCLENLHLAYVQFNDDETFQHLISGCPLLEVLTLYDVDHLDLLCRRIFSPTLKWLKIDFGFSVLDHSVELITPALRYLQVKGCSSKCISAKPLSSLSEAYIKLQWWKEVKVEDDVVYSGSALEFLAMMPNVKCLKFDICSYEFLPSAFPSWSPRFHNLIKLEMAADWRFIMKFLEMADNLQVLIVNPGTKDLKCWVKLKPQQVFTCLLSQLGSIVINYFCCKEQEYRLVQYLLKNGKVLTSMKIRCQVWDSKKKTVALKRISLFERGSDACKVDIY